MLLTLFLASLGTASLLPLYHIIKKRDADAVKGWTFHEDRLTPLIPSETKVKIRPVRAEGVVCQICIGKLKAGLPHIRCSCGKIFHITCLKRTGFCPYCQRTFTPEEVERDAAYPVEETLDCPVCGRAVSKEMGKCECGAIISDDDGRFYCPRCGTQIEEWENRCPHCQEVYEDVLLVQCPACGRVFEEGRGSCDCGAFFGEVCPECGVHLEPDDHACPNCGMAFEIID